MRLLLALLGLLVCCGCAKGEAEAPDRATVHALFGTHRAALPRIATSIPLPMAAKYWSYSADLAYPTPDEFSAELTADFAEADLAEQLVRGRLLLLESADASPTLLTPLDALAGDFLSGTTDPEQLPPLEELGEYLLARFPTALSEKLQRFLDATNVFNTIDPTIHLESGGLDFETYIRANNDFRRLRLANLLIAARDLKGYMPDLRTMASNPAHGLAWRMEAARTLYALGDTDQRTLLMTLAFSGQDTIPLYGWPTYAFLAERQDTVLYDSLKLSIEGATSETQGQYLVHLAQYGKPEDFPAIKTWALALLPRLPTPRTGPESAPQTSLLPETPLQVEFAQDSSASDPEPDPHYHDLSDLEIPAPDSTYGYPVEDVQTAQRIRVLDAFADSGMVLPALHEALLKGGPATRIAAGELLNTHGAAESLDLLKLTWEDETDPLVIAELTHAWWMIAARLEATD